MTLSSNEKEELAEYVFNSLIISMGFNTMNSELQSFADEMISNCSNRQETINLIISFTEDIDTPKSRYFRAMAFAYSNKPYWEEAIPAIENYLSNPLYDRAFVGHSHGQEFSEEDEKNIHLSKMYSELAKKYEQTKDFDNSLRFYFIALDYTPYYAHCYIHVAEVYRKMNKHDCSLKIYNSASKSRFYEPKEIVNQFGSNYIDDGFKKVIDDYRNRTVERINKGYVYRPRK